MLYGCSETEHLPIKKETYRFKTGFEAVFRYSGSFIEQQTNTEYLYFADPSTGKCLKIFDLNGVLTDSVPLTNAMSFIHDINGISVKSRDTIILNSAYTNLLAVINHSGAFIKTVEMDSLLKDPQGNHYELYSSFLANKLYGNSILFYCEWRYNIHDADMPDRLEDVLNFYKRNYTTPYFCKLQDYCSNTPKVKLGLTNYYSHFSKSDQNFQDVPRYTCVNNRVFLQTVYSNNLYVIDPASLTLQKIIPIQSMYSSIGAKPFPINKETIGNTQSIADSIMATTGAFFGVYYHAQTARYYITLYHAVPSYLEQQIGFKKLPYSFLSVDSNFTDFKEYKMPADSFFGGFSIMTRKGLLVNTPGKTIQESNSYTSFSRIEFND
ncbi:MAG: hypothetical protein HY062_11560 [Bacteroidetes bacterium]|nr:hypothetical protein [Bacteroidota bacterium]